jgi:hypothetical protein
MPRSVMYVRQAIQILVKDQFDRNENMRCPIHAGTGPVQQRVDDSLLVIAQTRPEAYMRCVR